MPNPERLLRTLHEAVLAFRTTPGRSGGVVTVTDAREVLIGGDLHGNLDNFRALLKKAELDAYPKRHLVLQEIIHSRFSYPQGGDKSHQLLDLVAALKCQYPDRVHFLLGNHELAQWRGHRIAKGDANQNDQFVSGVEQAYGQWSEPILAAYNELFAAADLAVLTTNRVWLSHSLPSARRLPTFDPA